MSRKLELVSSRPVTPKDVLKDGVEMLEVDSPVFAFMLNGVQMLGRESEALDLHFVMPGTWCHEDIRKFEYMWAVGVMNRAKQYAKKKAPSIIMSAYHE